MRLEKIGKWAFVAGVLIAILSGFVDFNGLTTILIVLGLIVGILNITAKEAEKFLVAAVALLIIGTAGISALFSSGGLVGTTQAILNNFVSFVSAAALVVALKAIVMMGEGEEKKVGSQ